MAPWVTLFKPISVVMAVIGATALTGCTPTPPDHRAQVIAPVYDGGDSIQGKKLYADHCEQCHTLKPGSNKKGPQLIGIYMSPSAVLEDYNYSEAMDQANWVWDAKTLDAYIADAEAALPDTRMLSDPMPNAQDRQDIIAYLSTLGRDPVLDSESDN
ncbi:c-type cytochrome [Psychrobacter lutiphocae]|nr:c-type cytochrome [Psychrobacter lutiphocae]